MPNKLLCSIFALCIISTISLHAHQLIIVRHGEGWHNIAQVFSSWTRDEGGADHPLTKKGKEQVAKTAQELLDQGVNRKNVAFAFVSPLCRTKQTAQIFCDYGVCSKQAIQIEENIREPRDLGLEGTVKPLNAVSNDWNKIVNLSAEQGGESVKDVYQRVQTVIHKLSKLDTDGYILVITHGFIAQAFFNLLGQEHIYLKTAEAKVCQLRQ